MDSRYLLFLNGMHDHALDLILVVFESYALRGGIEYCLVVKIFIPLLQVAGHALHVVLRNHRSRAQTLGFAVGGGALGQGTRRFVLLHVQLQTRLLKLFFILRWPLLSHI